MTCLSWLLYRFCCHFCWIVLPSATCLTSFLILLYSIFFCEQFVNHSMVLWTSAHTATPETHQISSNASPTYFLILGLILGLILVFSTPWLPPIFAARLIAQPSLARPYYASPSARSSREIDMAVPDEGCDARHCVRVVEDGGEMESKTSVLPSFFFFNPETMVKPRNRLNHVNVWFPCWKIFLFFFRGRITTCLTSRNGWTPPATSTWSSSLCLGRKLCHDCGTAIAIRKIGKAINNGWSKGLEWVLDLGYSQTLTVQKESYWNCQSQNAPIDKTGPMFEKILFKSLTAAKNMKLEKYKQTCLSIGPSSLHIMLFFSRCPGGRESGADGVEGRAEVVDWMESCLMIFQPTVLKPGIGIIYPLSSMFNRFTQVDPKFWPLMAMDFGASNSGQPGGSDGVPGVLSYAQWHPEHEPRGRSFMKFWGYDVTDSR